MNQQESHIDEAEPPFLFAEFCIRDCGFLPLWTGQLRFEIEV
jgi:hypothetical protein